MKPPVRCVILSIDPGSKCSGWAVYRNGWLIDSGEVDGYESGELRGVCAVATALAEEAGMDAVMVIEKCFSIRAGRRNGGNRAVWGDQWKKAGGQPSRIVRVHVGTWRARVLGNGGLSQKAARTEESKTANALCGSRAVTGHDEAAAICIGQWAVREQRVFDVLTKRQQKKCEGWHA